MLKSKRHTKPHNHKFVERWEQCLRVLKALTPHERRRHWDMGWYGTKTECGTVACAAGHCGLDPWFRRRGFKMDFMRMDYGLGDIEWLMDISDDEEFFGEIGSQNIFHNSKLRPVSQVIKEVKAHIQWLRANPDLY